ncbi:MAG: Cj0069 family protein [Isosphaeraceae bacterium]|nr:Cj0069 family protein [Isosphaeraceae bacterium]
MLRSVLFFEVEGGNDKGPDGHRKDTMPMVHALRALGWNAEQRFYRDHEVDALLEEIPAKFDAYVSRINPGHIPGGEAKYFELLRGLCDRGMVGMPHPAAMVAFGAKDALVKLAETDLVPTDTFAYYDSAQFREGFPKALSTGVRVLKQNRGSTGSGIWRVEVIDGRTFEPGSALPLDTKIKCTEALDNHTEERELGEFMTYCDQYLEGDGGQIVDMPFLPRIKEGEIRILFVGETPIFVVHKKPAEGGDAFSATLFSGAKYTYEEPSKWQELIDWFLALMPDVQKRLGGHDTPLIWTADFILDDAPEGGDRYILGEINCSCVGFTTHMEHGIQEKIAAQIVDSVTKKKGS